MPWRVTFVGQMGDVAPCCAPGRPVLGNVFERDFMDIWNGPEYRELREGFITGRLTEYCRGCLYLQEAGVMPYDARAYVIDSEE
jgi:MoaA/NifB/PqqE/SkfB family radical SAM enzyme